MTIEKVSKSQVEYVIDEWIIGKNAERNRKILKRRLIDGICYEPLSEEFDLSVQQIKNIVYKYEKIIFSKIKGQKNLSLNFLQKITEGYVQL